MSRYRKKPIEIEAVQWTGKNVDEINKFIGLCIGARAFWTHDLVYRPYEYEKGLELNIQTLEGTMKARVGDYIIKGVKRGILPLQTRYI